MQALSLDRAKFIIALARAYDAQVAPVIPDPGSNPTDDGVIEVLEDIPESRGMEQELRDALASLNKDEWNELLALLWVGRGDYTREEWPTAVTAASRYGTSRVDYLMRQPLLGDLIEEGLSEIGYTLEDLADMPQL